MRIREITRQRRHDFYAIFECEHCGESFSGPGYDDARFHEVALPKLKCKSCGMGANAGVCPDCHGDGADKYGKFCQTCSGGGLVSYDERR